PVLQPRPVDRDDGYQHAEHDDGRHEVRREQCSAGPTRHTEQKTPGDQGQRPGDRVHPDEDGHDGPPADFNTSISLSVEARYASTSTSASWTTWSNRSFNRASPATTVSCPRRVRRTILLRPAPALTVTEVAMPKVLRR